jgi:RNA polymerase sigma-70 factor (ECF subfamily)
LSLHFQNIIQQIKLGNEQPLIDLYKLYRNEFVVWSCKEFSANEEQAKDAFQEAILDFNDNIIRGYLTEFSSSVKTYLFQIGKHKVINLIKKESRITYNDNLQLIKGNEYEDYMDDENKAYTQEQISSAINKLPEDCQKVLKLHYFNEYDMGSIAREMEYKNADTAKSKKSVCMKRLITELNKFSKILLF